MEEHEPADCILSPTPGGGAVTAVREHLLVTQPVYTLPQDALWEWKFLLGPSSSAAVLLASEWKFPHIQTQTHRHTEAGREGGRQERGRASKRVRAKDRQGSSQWGEMWNSIWSLDVWRTGRSPGISFLEMLRTTSVAVSWGLFQLPRTWLLTGRHLYLCEGDHRREA